MKSPFSSQLNQTKRGILVLFSLLVTTLASGSTALAYGLSTHTFEELAAKRFIDPFSQGYTAFQESWEQNQKDAFRRKSDHNYVRSIQMRIYQETAILSGQTNINSVTTTKKVVRNKSVTENEPFKTSWPSSVQQQSAQSGVNTQDLKEFQEDIEAQKAAFAAEAGKKMQEAQDSAHQNYLEAQQQAQLDMGKAKSDSTARIEAFKALHDIR